MVGLASCSKFERVNLTTPEPEHREGSSNVPNPPITDLVTPEPGYAEGLSNIPKLLINNLLMPEPALFVDLSNPEPDQHNAVRSHCGILAGRHVQLGVPLQKPV